MVELMPLLKVNYSENPPHIFRNLNDMLDIENPERFSKIALGMIATKDNSWSNEREYRFIRPTSGMFYHHKSAIKSITIGAKQTDNDVMYKVLSCADKVGIPVYIASLNGYNIERTIKFKPEEKPNPTSNSRANQKATELVKNNQLPENLISAITHAYMSAKNDPHCVSLVDYDVYTSGEYMWFNYECSLPDTGNIAEVNRRKQMKFKLIDGKFVRDWSVRISERHYI